MHLGPVSPANLHLVNKSLSQVYHDRRFLSAAPQALVQRHGSKQAGKETGSARPRLPTALGSRGAGPGRRRAGGGYGGGLAWPRRTGPGLSLAVPHSASGFEPSQEPASRGLGRYGCRQLLIWMRGMQRTEAIRRAGCPELGRSQPLGPSLRTRPQVAQGLGSFRELLWLDR